MRKYLRPILTVILVIFVAGIIVYPKLKDSLFSKPQNNMAKGTSARSSQKLNVNGLLITPAVVTEYVNTLGSLIPDEEVELSFETSGKIVEILFSEGTKVEKGQLLAKINDRHLQAQLLKLEAQRKLSQEKEFRQRSLLDKDAISRESYDQIVTELQSTDADILLVKARIAETELRAPFSGIIGLRLLSEGSYTSPSSKIARLVKVKPLKIEFSVPERYAGEVGKGFPITFVIDGILKTFSAEVYAVDPKVDLKTRTVNVRALFPNNNEELRPGRFAAITLKLAEVKDAISIPSESLIPEMDGEKVFVYRSGVAKKLDVITGLRTESSIQILKGIEFGDTLITSGILQLREKLPVVLDTVIVNR